MCPYFGILAENPFPPERGYITGATAPRPCWGLRPKARMLWLLAKSFARRKTNIASNAKHPFLSTIEVYRQPDADGKSRPHQFVEKVCYFKKVLIRNPIFKNYIGFSTVCIKIEAVKKCKISSQLLSLSNFIKITMQHIVKKQ